MIYKNFLFKLVNLVLLSNKCQSRFQSCFCTLVIYTQLSLKFWKYKDDCRIQREWRTSGEHSPLNKLNRVNLGSQQHGILSWVCMMSFTQMLWLLTWCFLGTPNSGSGCDSDTFVCSWVFSPVAQLSCEGFHLVICNSFCPECMSFLGNMLFSEEEIEAEWIWGKE